MGEGGIILKKLNLIIFLLGIMNIGIFFISYFLNSCHILLAIDKNWGNLFLGLLCLWSARRSYD